MFGSTAPHNATHPTNGCNDYYLLFLALEPPARPRHHSRVQTGERHPRPPRLFRPRWICTRLPDRLHQLSKPDTSAWCPSLPRGNAWRNVTEGRGPCRNRMEPARLRPETARKLLIGKAIVEQ